VYSSGFVQNQPSICCPFVRREALRSQWLQINIINIDLSRLIAVVREYGEHNVEAALDRPNMQRLCAFPCDFRRFYAG